MINPWKEINLDDYENHMCLDGVYQLQTLNQMMNEQFNAYHIKSLMILGIAGGNGLEHIDIQKFNRIYGIDINEDYLNICNQRYPMLKSILETRCLDLTSQINQLPYADFVVANLFIEYVGYECFQKAIKHIKPMYISCVIQVNENNSFLSNSPYISVFDHLGEILHSIEQSMLTKTMCDINYLENGVFESKLPNGKKLVRIDYVSKSFIHQ
jgi:hypothetical protein